jgi:hypothetical protein
MNRFSLTLSVQVLPVLALGACGEASEEVELLLPEEVSVEWDRAYNAQDDGLGALVPVDVMVYEGATGDPLPHVQLAVWTDSVSAWPVPVDEVWLLAAGEVEREMPGLVQAWDATRDQFVAFEPMEGIELRTDEGGVARLYVYVDAFPEAGETADFEPIRVLVSMGSSEELFWLTPR